MSATRPHVEQFRIDTARRLARQYERATRKAAEANRSAREATDELRAIHAATEARLSLSGCPADPFLLDVLAMVERRHGSVWHWTGPRNNKNLATIRVPDGGSSSEKSVVRYLAVTFGLIGPDDNGMLFPVGTTTDDVNPWHRKLRRSDEPVGRTEPGPWPAREAS